MRTKWWSPVSRSASGWADLRNSFNSFLFSGPGVGALLKGAYLSISTLHSGWMRQGGSEGVAGHLDNSGRRPFALTPLH